MASDPLDTAELQKLHFRVEPKTSLAVRVPTFIQRCSFTRALTPELKIDGAFTAHLGIMAEQFESYKRFPSDTDLSKLKERRATVQ